MHAGFKVYKYKIIIYYKGELQGNAHEEHGLLSTNVWTLHNEGLQMVSKVMVGNDRIDSAQQ